MLKRFALFTGAEYETPLGLRGYVISYSALKPLKNFILKHIKYNDICFEEWQVDDMKMEKILFWSGPGWNISDDEVAEFLGIESIVKGE